MHSLPIPMHQAALALLQRILDGGQPPGLFHAGPEVAEAHGLLSALPRWRVDHASTGAG